jgi:hypothetical protein
MLPKPGQQLSIVLYAQIAAFSGGFEFKNQIDEMLAFFQALLRALS